MGIRDLGFGPALRARLPLGIRSLPAGARKVVDLGFALIRWKAFRIAAAIGLLLCALGLGLWARDFSGQEAVRGWLLGHLPPQDAWDSLVTPYGLRRLAKPELMQRALRGLPSGLDAPGTIWLGDGGDWLAVFPGADDAGLARLYCGRCELRSPVRWQPAGTGWIGLVEARKALEKWKTLVAQAARQRPKEPPDPREIRY